MKRKIGVTNWIFGDVDLIESAKIIASMGFDGMEVYVDIEKVSSTEVKKVLNDHNLDVFSLTPANFDLANNYLNCRQIAIDYYKKLIDYGAELGHPVITCHEYIQNQSIKDYLGAIYWLIDSCKKLAIYAQKANINLGFEPLNRYLCRFILTSVDVVELINQVDAHNLTIILDTFHMNLEENDLNKAIIMCKDKLSIYQIADSNRKRNWVRSYRFYYPI
ncbi:sugar phosphate isomerase/epimerase family protein [Aphanothece sacrum]|uniref:D-tagatose 3-epimerase n=1 Tax=Aphanothece sacrum FPU1 TaxID=1920663 RepID=A0A401IH64_APHSA|nr:sugar phosphate isomerase/epimerase family protein [Aphanothece sacrum]GBF80637.1 D-tagatose 3-epimerase [Aphanothece sacrum FPU1]